MWSQPVERARVLLQSVEIGTNLIEIDDQRWRQDPRLVALWYLVLTSVDLKDPSPNRVSKNRDALRRFSQEAKSAQEETLEELVNALVELAQRNPTCSSEAKDALKDLKNVAELSERAETQYLRLCVYDAILNPDRPDPQKLLQHCKTIRKMVESDAVIDVCYVESCILLARCS